MAIHAKSNGLLIGGKVISESDDRWVFQAMDNKRPTIISKHDEKNRVFGGDNAVNDAMDWQEKTRKKK